ncbi:hypothetical protein [Treponema peruense]|uniref:Uncharacterized protein n=1 Tax=Treponema peruense TaxID=2787628 RepID=A0A7T3RFE2_9SPIR|nr:hypothetical protein [Treponema peruense]QQA02091.1 hypothetical protein IWA51_05815 [Treponema peruense]
MNQTAKMTLARSSATAGAAVLCALASKIQPVYGTEFLVPAAVTVAAVLGRLTGSGALGLLVILQCAGLPVLGTGTLTGLKFFSQDYCACVLAAFTAAFVSGLGAGTPYVTEKKFSTKRFARTVLASAAGYAAAFLTLYICFRTGLVSQAARSGPFIFTAMTAATSLLALLLRPAAASLLYPSESLEKEADEAVQRLKQKKTARQKK